MGMTGIKYAAGGLVLLLATACGATATPRTGTAPVRPLAGIHIDRPDAQAGPVTLAFAGDVHFQLQVAELIGDPRGLGPMARALATADVAMVNLETAITERGVPDAKNLEDAWDRYWFRAPAPALDFLADAGVDVVSVANNHGADYGPVGLQDTLRAGRNGPLAMVGAGRDRQAAFTPHRVTVRGTELAILGADASPLESTAAVWSAGRRTPGLAAAHEPRPRALLAAVRRADRDADVVVVYLHWGAELQACPTDQQRTTARALARAGADVVVGSHAHVLLGSGWQGDAYVNYGLGNFVWYHDQQPDTGVLRLTVDDGKVVADEWVPAEIGGWGRPQPLSGADRKAKIADWRGLRGCAGLSPTAR